MEISELEFSVIALAKPEDLAESELPDGFECAVGPDIAQGYKRGNGDRLALAARRDGDKAVVGAAGGVLLIHAQKQPIFFVVNSSVEKPALGIGLEQALVDLLIANIRAEKDVEVRLAREIAALHREAGASFTPQEKNSA